MPASTFNSIVDYHFFIIDNKWRSILSFNSIVDYQKLAQAQNPKGNPNFQFYSRLSAKMPKLLASYLLLNFQFYSRLSRLREFYLAEGFMLAFNSIVDYHSL
ncbi:Chromosome partition protein MukB [Saccharolobus shibatae B12]|uniref:Chromosome partition protein MukB n=1 Tax=Saccharolobus shibatae (strain ATCC 51178 / DSM 5389 / JCM 8931 / NBRC 15437 / B12) TaxID=523848 RepID=A0A8F5BP31_SACSH|nr:Chromosome partition protein MukB [Saccharolobus shibatae B12]